MKIDEMLQAVKHIMLALVGLFAVLAFGWNLFVSPEFGLRPLDWGGALGLTALVAAFIATTYLLKEGKSD